MKETKDRGITLVALVITIIILLILAGITILALSGENGLIAKTKLAKERYSISETKEKLELSIMELRIEQESKGESLTKEDLPKLNNDEIDVGSIESFPVQVIYGKYKFNVDENFVVTYVGEADGIIITYTTDPVGYTNQDEVKILIKVSSPKGIKTIEYPDGDKLEVNEKTEVGIDYKVTANGTYTFKVIDIENNEETKEVVIDQIDKLQPLDFAIMISDVKLHSFTVTVDIQDAEPDETNTKSGIEKYEFYIKKTEEIEYTKYEFTNSTNIIDNLDGGTEYEFYVIAYDRAENYKTSEVQKQETDSQSKEIYIDVNNGSDETGDGTESKPYSTLEKIAEEGIIETGTKYNIFLSNGEYNLVENLFVLNCNKSINIYGNKQNTILKVSNIYKNNLNGSENYSVNIYRVVWKGIENDTNTVYIKNPIKFYNVVFTFTFNQTNTPGGYFCENNLYMQNCTINKWFHGAYSSGWTEKNSGFIRGTKNKLINCYGGMKSGYGTTDDMWNYQTNYITTYTPLVDSTTYRITDDESVWRNVGTGTDPDGSQADLGVYGGEYSWEN